jgi:protein ImuB
MTEGGRQLLAAVNPAAAAKGLRAGMPLADALSFLPGLLTRPAELAEDAAALHRLAEWCGRYSPWTAPDGADGIKIEITGSAHLWGGEAALAADLSRRLARQGIAYRLAIADTLGAAWAVARYASGETAGNSPGCKSDAKTASIVIPSGETRGALAPLPVAALRLDPAIVDDLRRVGLRRIGEVLAMPRDALARRFGPDGLNNTVAKRLDQALDALPEPLSPLGETPTRRVRLSFAEPIADPADLARAAERLTEDLVTRLAREGMGARRLDLGFHRVDGRVEHIRLGTARPSRDPVHLAKLLIGKFDTIDPGLGVEDVILAAFAVEKLAPEQIGMAGGGATAGDTASLFDRLGARLGLDALARLEPRASHIPERASVAAPIANNPHPPVAVAARSLPRTRGKVGEGTPQKPPRPVRLFAPPEPVEAFWVLPDDPPFRFTWRRRIHRIAQADGPERIAEEWWRPDGQLIDGDGDPNAIRDYYRVEDEAGRRFWLFRAGLPGDPPPRWYVHGVFS